MDTLVLNVAWQPVARISWERAFILWFEKKVEIVEEYEDRKIRSATSEWAMPSIVRFVKTIKRNRKGVKFSRENVFARDGGKCVYCMTKVERSDFTYDHVIPRSQGGQTTWQNVAVACTPCNQKKGGRTPEQARMPMPKTLYKPRADQLSEALLMHVSWRPGMPESWKAFMRDTLYWKDSLDE